MLKQQFNVVPCEIVRLLESSHVLLHHRVINMESTFFCIKKQRFIKNKIINCSPLSHEGTTIKIRLRDELNSLCPVDNRDNFINDHFLRENDAWHKTKHH